MYIDSIKINNFRTFRDVEIAFTHSDCRPTEEFPAPKLPNVNLLLGNNGMGKTTLLKAIALAALGPAVSDSRIDAYRLVRREPGHEATYPQSEAIIQAQFTTHPQDELSIGHIESEITVSRRMDVESLRWPHKDAKGWDPIFSSSSDAFFFVGYGATRRVEKLERTDMGARRHTSFARAQRIMSLFEEAYSLLPLSVWLPSFRHENPGRYKQVVDLMNKLLKSGKYTFTGDMEESEYIYEYNGLRVPFPALSDGYRAYVGWAADLLYHICMTCPSGSKLVDNHGIVMVDEVDLHIHPKWQMKIIHDLAKALPNVQFILTSHSPLVVGSLEWMNIIFMKPGTKGSSKPERIKEGVHGLDADQILLSEFFGLSSTRAPSKDRRLQTLTNKARGGDETAAKALLKELSIGMEE